MRFRSAAIFLVTASQLLLPSHVHAQRFAQTKPCSVATCKVGDTGPGGGVIFYKAPKQMSWGQFLEVAPASWNGKVDPSSQWGCMGTSLGATSLAIGTGKANTVAILKNCKTNSAAKVAAAYRGGKLSDWFLPSEAELTELLTSGVAIGIGGVDFYKGTDWTFYWSSTEYCLDKSKKSIIAPGQAGAGKSNFGMCAMAQRWDGVAGTKGTMAKSEKIAVRAIRSF